MIAFMRQLNFFKDNKIKDRGILEACFGMEFKEAKKGFVVCRFGHKGDNFYILLKGKCSVWVPMPP
jgi:hypothetical protein